MPVVIAGDTGRIEVRHIEARPQLTLVSRDGDPTPAIVVAVATDLGPVATTALSAIVEARLRGAGLPVGSSVDRSSFRVRFAIEAPARTGALLKALAASFAKPITPGAPELELVAERLQALRRNPLDAVEMVPVAACTGRLGIVATEPVPDVRSAAGVAELERWRAASLHARRSSVAVVGPAALCAAVASELEQTSGWQTGPAAEDSWPSADAIGMHASHALPRRSARATIAVRVADPHAAVGAAERLGAADSALLARLPALPYPWRATEIVAVARPRGGCVSVTVETSELPTGTSLERSAAHAAALVRREISLEVDRSFGSSLAARQILTASDPTEAASRAAWWALAGSAVGAPARTAVALAVPAAARTPEGGARDSTVFAKELEKALLVGSQRVAELRFGVERGQGEIWALLASPCGVGDEAATDAGSTALSALAAVRSGPIDTDVRVEPWVTSDGVGLLAHAPFSADDETGEKVARRVADALGRSLVTAAIAPDALAAARGAVLEHLDRSWGRHALALDAGTRALVPEHPSWLEPLGAWSRVASAGIDGVRLRWRALGSGPLRLAVLANVSATQATVAAEAFERWVAPRFDEHACEITPPSPPRPGRHEVRLPRGSFAELLVAVDVEPAERELAVLTSMALGDAGGLLSQTVRATLAGAPATARVLGGSRAAALVIDVQAQPDASEAAESDVGALLGKLAQGGATEADFARASALAAQRTRTARADPRHRLAETWAGEPSARKPPPDFAAWQAWLSSHLAAHRLVVVVGKPEG